MTGCRRTLSRTASFFTTAAVLVVALWASGAPSMVYPVFADRWGAGEVVTTALFATYPVALVAALLACGSLSDVIGRRRVLLTGTTLLTTGTAVFVITDDIAGVFAGRALQGVGVGVAVSAATAALTEFAPRRDPGLATSVNTAATASGTASALVIGGALAAYSSAPTRLPFLVLLVVCAGLIPLLRLLPERQVSGRRGWRPSPVRLPRANRGLVWTGIGSLTVAFMVGAVFIALGAQVVRDLVGTPNALTASLLLATWAMSVVPASILARRAPPQLGITWGSGLAVVGCALLVLAANHESVVAFVVSAVLSGAGYGLMFHGGLGLVSSSAEADVRAGTLALMYLVAYCAQGTTAVAIGWIATTSGLSTAIDIAVPMIAALGVLGGLGSWFLGIRSRT